MENLKRKITGYENYTCTIDGIIKNEKTGNILKVCKNKHGTEVYNLYKNGKLNVLTKAKIIGICFIENPYNYNLIYHKDNNKLNYNIDNLEWKTNKNRYVIENDIVKIYCIHNNYFIIDLDELENVKKYQWYIDGNYVCHFDPKTKNKIRLHNYILNSKNIDHVNHNKLDNRKCNLRKCTVQENNRNKLAKDNHIIGVSVSNYSKRGVRWRAYIVVNRKNILLLSSYKKEDCIKARLKAEKQYFGEFAPQKYLFEKYGIS